MKYIDTRKTIALLSILTVVFTIVYCLITGKEPTQTVYALLMALTGYIGYYFGKSTALDMPKKEGENK